MKELYKKLFEACKDEADFKKSAHFVSVKGKNYENNDVRFMSIGRAPNGWRSLPTDSAESFGQNAQQCFESTQGFSWIKSFYGVLYNESKDYCVSGAPYWSYSRAIWEGLFDGDTSELVWQENIVWSNLYKISPNDGDPNPGEESRMLQLETCKSILKKELDEYKPTHILIFTGFDVWFDSFKDVFQNVVDLGVRNISKGPSKNDVFVEGTATYGDAKVVVACRPEYRNAEQYVEQVLREFRSQTNTIL